MPLISLLCLVTVDKRQRDAQHYGSHLHTEWWQLRTEVCMDHQKAIVKTKVAYLSLAGLQLLCL